MGRITDCFIESVKLGKLRFDLANNLSDERSRDFADYRDRESRLDSEASFSCSLARLTGALFAYCTTYCPEINQWAFDSRYREKNWA